jgi:SAM-dependent methyltransferase
MSEHLERNRREWNRWADNYVEPGRRNWSRSEVAWGELKARESDLKLLGDVAAKDVLELGCGTAYFSSWLARRGARPVGLDLSERQLETARLFQREFGLVFPLVQANAEQVPMHSGTFDLVLSEYGASIWADPYAWVPEAARLLRPGGELVFLVNGTLSILCMPDEEEVLPPVDQLLRPYFGLHRMQWKSDDSVAFHLGYGAWIALLRANGFEIEAPSLIRCGRISGRQRKSGRRASTLKSPSEGSRMRHLTASELTRAGWPS